MATNGNMPAEITLSDIQAALDLVKSRFETEGYTLAIITADRYKDALDIVEWHYSPDEPLCRVFGVQWTEENIREGRFIDKLRENLSVMVVSKDDQRLVGAMISETMRRADSYDLSKLTSEPLRDMAKFEYQKDSEIDFFNRFGVDEALHFFVMGVHRDFRRKGIATKLFQASMALGVELGFKAVKVEASSGFTQKICDKEGFTTLWEIPYDECFYNGQSMRSKTLSHSVYKIVGKAL